MNPVNLCFREACHVTRPEMLCRSLVVNPGSPVARKVAPAGCTFTSPTLPDAKNHSLSLTIGPPTDGATSMRCSSESADRRTFLKSALKLSDCQPLNDPPTKTSPENLLPPSRGIMLIRTPPPDVSAPSELVWYETSWTIAKL